jgi:hypothetical protein
MNYMNENLNNIKTVESKDLKDFEITFITGNEKKEKKEEGFDEKTSIRANFSILGPKNYPIQYKKEILEFNTGDPFFTIKIHLKEK